MAYIDVSYYRGEYKGTEIEDVAELERLLERASGLVDELAGYRIKPGGVSKAVKDAVACEAEYLYLNGGVSAALGASEDGARVSLGSFSYGGDGGQASGGGADKRFARGAVSLLAGAGLLYRGGSVC